MVEAVHEIGHEAQHEAAHSGTGRAKMIGLLISVLALMLAVSEMLGKSAQTHGLTHNIHSSDTWNFYQAKTVRQTMVRAMLDSGRLANPAPNEAAQKQFAAWQANIERWESEPSTGEGRKELMAKAKDLETQRDGFLERYHAYEVVSLILQLGIVLASVSLLSSIMAFAAASVALGGIGLVLLAGTYANFGPIMHLLH